MSIGVKVTKIINYLEHDITKK